MELRHLRYFVAAAEEQHFGRAAERLRIAQPALSRQIQDLENEIGFELFDRLPRGVKISAAGKSLLEDARSILKQADEAVRRAGKVAHQSGILRVGFIESLSWHGVVPRSFRQFRRRHPDARLELRSLSSLDQVEAVRLGKLDAGYVHRPLIKDRNLAHVPVALHNVMLALPQGHSLLKVKPLRLRDLRDTAFVWFSKRTNPVFHRQLMQQCNRGGLKHPQIVQEAINEPTILSQVACKLGVAFVSGATRWRRPKGVAMRSVVDLDLPIPFSLVWRKDNISPLLAAFVGAVQSIPEVAAFSKS